MNNQKKYSIIVAGGTGSRMKSVIAKQFLPLKNKPILSHTVEKFLLIPNNTVIAVLPEKDLIFWDEILQSNPILLKAAKNGTLQTVKGGKTRFQSVFNGLETIKGNTGIVAIHDGVRPLISKELILESFIQAEINGSAVLAVEIKDSVRIIKDNGSNQYFDRTKLKLVQTPQTFQLDLIKKAFSKGEETFFTDDASVYDYAGYSVFLIDGDYRNIKITTPEDLDLAELWFK